MHTDIWKRPCPTSMTVLLSAVVFLCSSLFPLTARGREWQGAPNQEVEVIPGTEGKPYHFSADWFGPKIPSWTKLLAEFAGRPDIRYLEVGVFEGRSFLWMVDHILTDPTATAVGVDIFLAGYQETLMSNVEVSGQAEKITIIDGYGELVMKTFPEESFDLIYIDGGHAAWTVFQQTALAWQLLKAEGILIFDDYLWHKGKRPADLRPEIAVNAFLASFAQHIEVLHKGKDVFVRKVKRLCEVEEGRNAVDWKTYSKSYYCSPLFDRFVYDWGSRRLFVAADNREIQLSEREKDLCEKVLLRISEPDFTRFLQRIDSYR